MQMQSPTELLNFYLEPIMHSTDILHCEFMDKERLKSMFKNQIEMNDKKALILVAHIEKYSLQESKERIKGLGLSYK